MDVHRFIPACAGNGVLRGVHGSSPPVHPRVCGERGVWRSSSYTPLGSSPRVRGTGRAKGPVGDSPRFIPACAGNGKSVMPTADSTPVHPRVCGEREIGISLDVDSDGSSPRVRGTGVPGQGSGFQRRFIPACAGNGSSSPTTTRSSTVHPRVCGERLVGESCRRINDGSSPRVRGTAFAGAVDPQRFRFIPACAGNGIQFDRLRLPPPVHPRVCGERAVLQRQPDADHGSSPRVRGTD